MTDFHIAPPNPNIASVDNGPVAYYLPEYLKQPKIESLFKKRQFLTTAIDRTLQEVEDIEIPKEAILIAQLISEFYRTLAVKQSDLSALNILIRSPNSENPAYAVGLALSNKWQSGKISLALYQELHDSYYQAIDFLDWHNNCYILDHHGLYGFLDDNNIFQLNSHYLPIEDYLDSPDIREKTENLADTVVVYGCKLQYDKACIRPKVDSGLIQYIGSFINGKFIDVLSIPVTN